MQALHLRDPHCIGLPASSESCAQYIVSSCIKAACKSYIERLGVRSIAMFEVGDRPAKLATLLTANFGTDLDFAGHANTPRAYQPQTRLADSSAFPVLA